MKADVKLGDIIRFKDDVWLFEVVKDNGKYMLRRLDYERGNNGCIDIDILFDNEFEVIKDISYVKCGDICCSACPLYRFHVGCRGEINIPLFKKLEYIKEDIEKDKWLIDELEEKWRKIIIK